jgi:hypothetical protein
VGNTKRHGAIALLEFETVAAGVLAGDAMVKRAPIALMRCGSIHPGRFLILIGGSVASTEEAYAAGLQVGASQGAISGNVFLGSRVTRWRLSKRTRRLRCWLLWMLPSKVRRSSFRKCGSETILVVTPWR